MSITSVLFCQLKNQNQANFTKYLPGQVHVDRFRWIEVETYLIICFKMKKEEENDDGPKLKTYQIPC